MLDLRIKKLLNDYLNGTSDPNEDLELAAFINSLTDEELDSLLCEFWNEFEPTSDLSLLQGQEILHRILSTTKEPKQDPFKIVRLIKIITAVAATIAVIFSAGVFLNRRVPRNEATRLVLTIQPDDNNKKPYTRQIQLPDHSVIVLQAGSRLRMINDFKGHTREVALEGEAYFDIYHDNKHPFIIHSYNRIKTTVLGTAFAIRAWPKERKVTVSVTRGKVKVEANAHLLAYLSVNQQVRYDIDKQDIRKNSVNVNKDIDVWAQKDLIFRDQSLSEVAAVLSKRYGVQISIPDPTISQARMVSSFSKTESLDNILDIICTLNSNIKYTTTGNSILFSKK